MELDPKALSGSERYKLLTGAITPRPIAFVSTRSSDGRDNLAPFSFFTPAGMNPMSLLFVVGTPSDGEDKDTLANALPPSDGGLGCFVVNVAVEAYAREMAAAAEELPPTESEFDLAGFTAAPSRVVAAPRVLESPVSFECETSHINRLGGATVVIGRVVHIFVRDDLVDERYRIDHAKLATIGRMPGDLYCRTRDLFSMPRGRAALEADTPFPEEPGPDEA